MTVYFSSNALNNEYAKDAIGKVQVRMDKIQKQINTEKQNGHFYELSPSEATELLNHVHAIEEEHQNVSILKEGLHKINEMSTHLEQLRKVANDGLLSWQKKGADGDTSNIKTEEIKEFAKNMLSSFEVILNKRSEYDGTYLFAGEDVDTKPVNVNEDNYYRGSKRNISFTYHGHNIELNFNAGDKSISDMITLLQSMKDGSKNAKEVFDDLKTGVDKIMKSKKEIDFKSYDIKKHLDQEEAFLTKNVEKYDTKMKTDNVLALTDLTRISGNLQAIYTSNKILLSTKLVNFL